MRPVNTNSLILEATSAYRWVDGPADEADPANSGDTMSDGSSSSPQTGTADAAGAGSTMSDGPSSPPPRGVKRPGEDAGIGSRDPELRARIRLDPVQASLTELEGLLQTSYREPAGWSDVASKNKGRKLKRSIEPMLRSAHREPTARLIALTGPYCAYCEAAQQTGLEADPIKPAMLFPLEALEPAGLLLACPACRDSKKRAMKRANGIRPLDRSSVGLIWDRVPIRPAWPHLYWKELGATRLPFANRLYSSHEARSVGNPVLSRERERSLVEAYRRGRIRVDRSRSPRLVLTFGDVADRTNETPPVPQGDRAQARRRIEMRRRSKRPESDRAEQDVPLYLTVRIEPVDGPLGRSAAETIRLLDLNGDAHGRDDRRQELRTGAYLSALDFRDRFDSLALIPGSGPDVTAMCDLLAEAVRATGFWSVWADVLGDSNLELDFNDLLPGTVAMPAGS